jgi:steroid delta-isomerase-like uncharacterized protein
MTWIDDYLDAFSNRDWSKVGEFFAEDSTYDNFGINAVFRGREAIVEFHKSVLDLASDSRFVIKNTLRDGDQYVVEFGWSGTNTGPGATFPTATNKPFSIAVIIVSQLNPDGKIELARSYFNLADFLQQIGVLPTPA